MVAKLNLLNNFGNKNVVEECWVMCLCQNHLIGLYGTIEI